MSQDEDILYSILLNSDIDTIMLLCNTYNRTIVKICNNNYFWKEKIIHDKLPLLIDDSKITMNYYKKIYNLYIDAINLLSEYNTIKYIPIKYEEIYKILPSHYIDFLEDYIEDNDETFKYVVIKLQYLHSKNLPMNITLELYENGNNWLTESGDDEFIEDVTKNDIIDTIIKLNWYYPNIEHF